MALRNVVREESRLTGTDSFRLRDPHGNYILAFDAFAESIEDQKYATRKRYCEVVSCFIDYLYEVKIVGDGPVTRSAVNRAVDYYVVLLRDGDQIKLYSVPEAEILHPGDIEVRQAALRDVARRLDIQPLAANSWSNTVAPLNRFLRTCELLEREAHEIALYRARIAPEIVNTAFVNYLPLIDAIEGSSLLTRAEVAHIKFSSVLGGVIRFRGADLTRPKGIRGPKLKDKQQDTKVFDFPMRYFSRVLENATSWRDRALWLLEAAAGIRRSEALNLEWHQIDLEKQTVYVLDPTYLRFGKEVSAADRHDRFKGRTVSWTYLRMPYRQQFFEALLEYRKREYVLPEDGNDYVFQYVESTRRGVPYRMASDKSFVKAFKAVVVRAGVPGPPMSPEHVWTEHSLRHAYGVFMLNDFQLPNRTAPGLTETSVQVLMGM
jgi:hypothetical protein